MLSRPVFPFIVFKQRKLKLDKQGTCFDGKPSSYQHFLSNRESSCGVRTNKEPVLGGGVHHVIANLVVPYCPHWENGKSALKNVKGQALS